MIKKIEGDVRRPSPALAERLAVCLGLSAGERKDFLAAARGLRPVDALAVNEMPVSRPAPLDRLPTPGTPFIGRLAETATLVVLLIGKCFLQFQPADERYQLHEVLRQYGHEQLASAGQLAAVERRHFEYCLAWAETANVHLFGADQVTWLDRLEADHDNARAALAWGLSQPAMAELAAQLTIALAWFWRIRSHVLEGRTWLEQAILLPDLTTATRAGLLYHAGHLAWMQDDFALARVRAEESLQLWQSLGPAGRCGAGYASHTLGMALYGTELRAPGDLTAAMHAFQASRDLFDEIGDAWGVAFAQQWLAFGYIALGNRAAARTVAEASLAGFQHLGNPWGAGMTLSALANLKLQAGDLAEARQLAEEAQAMRRQVGHRHSVGVGLELLARIALQENKAAEAAAYYEEAILVFDGMGNQPSADQLRAALAALPADSDCQQQP